MRDAMTDQETKIATLFLEYSRRKLLEQDWPRLRGCVEWLSDEQIWWRPNPASNSIGNLILHLDGNIHQWLVDSFHQRENHRDRLAEFTLSGWMPTTALLARLGATLQEASEVLALLNENDLAASFEIQGNTVTGLEAIYKAVEHFAMHYGQILYIVKSLRNVDLGFYRELNKTDRAE